MAAIDSPIWDDSAWSPLPALATDVDADVCVVGLGGSGLACVHELLRLGQRVVGVDGGAVGGGAAGRNGGFLLAGTYEFYHDAVAAYGRERARAIYRATLEEMDRIDTETPALVRRTGSLRIATTPGEEADCARQLDAMRADDLPAEEYDGPEGVGLLIPTDGVYEPLARCRTMARRAIDGGASLFERSQAVIGDGEVRVGASRVRCERVIVAVDGRLSEVLPELGGTVRTARLQMLATAPAPEVRFPRPVYARYGFEYWQQLPDGRIALGGFRDLGGESEWTTDTTPSAVVQGALERFLREELRVVAPITHRWGAAAGYTASGLPFVGEVRPGVWALGGYCGTGNVIGRLLGRAVARWAVRGDASGVAPFAEA